MEHLLLVIHVVIAAALIGAVLLQRSETDGFGLGSGSGQNLLSGRGAANLMTRTTAVLAALFIIMSLVLGIIASRGSKGSIVDSIPVEDTTSEPSVPLAVESDKDSKAVAPALNRDAAVNTDNAAKKASAKKAAPAKETDAEAPAVPTAE